LTLLHSWPLLRFFNQGIRGEEVFLQIHRSLTLVPPKCVAHLTRLQIVSFIECDDFEPRRLPLFFRKWASAIRIRKERLVGWCRSRTQIVYQEQAAGLDNVVERSNECLVAYAEID